MKALKKQNAPDLREITGQLRRALKFDDGDMCDKTGANTSTIKTNEGYAFIVGLSQQPGEGSVAFVYADAGTKMTWHKHDVTEYVIMFSGELHLTLEGEGYEPAVLRKRDIYRIRPGVPHRAVWPTDSKMLVATIPHSGGFPNARP